MSAKNPMQEETQKMTLRFLGEEAKRFLTYARENLSKASEHVEAKNWAAAIDKMRVARNDLQSFEWPALAMYKSEVPQYSAAEVLADLSDGVTMELIDALRCPRGWRWFASTDVMEDVWPVGPAKTMQEALDKLLCLIFANDAVMPRTGEVVVCVGRKIRKADLEDGFSDDLAWVIETNYALRVRLQLDLLAEKKGGRP